MIKIGQLAEQSGCQVVTIRYYEKEGLMKKPARSQNGYRFYTINDVERLHFIRHCRDHGMPLLDIKSLLELREAPERDCSVVNELVDHHIQKLEAQILSIKKLKSQLVELRKKCHHQGSIATCGILRGLADRSICGCLQTSEIAPKKKTPKGSLIQG